tara:strand:- start:1969 stop:2454 length:486 start_codon:yes stop_codon:yes gene_type:complete
MNLLQLCDDLQEKIGDEIKLQPKYKFKKILAEMSNNSIITTNPRCVVSSFVSLTDPANSYVVHRNKRWRELAFCSPFLTIRWITESPHIPYPHFYIQGICDDGYSEFGETWVFKDYTDKILEIAHNEGIHSITRQILNPTLLRDVKRGLRPAHIHTSDEED